MDIDNEYDDLYKAIEKKDWNDARRLINSAHSYRYIEYVDDEAFNALHLACVHDAPLDIVQSILSASNIAALQQDIYGLTPLRLSLQFASDELIKIMIVGCPQAAFIIDDENHSTALHDAVLYNKSLDVFRQLLIANSSATRVVDGYNLDTPLGTFFNKWDLGLQAVLNPLKNNRCKIPDFDIIDEADQDGTIKGLSLMTPFKAMCLALTKPECPWSFFNMMIKIYPEAVYEHDDDGNYLLHIAVLAALSCDDEDDKQSMVSKIVFIGDLASFHNSDHKLPLHLAIEQGKSLYNDITQVIFEANPRALEARDLSTHLYPFALSAVNKTRHLDMSKEDITKMKLQQMMTSYSLLTESPSLVLVEAFRNELNSKYRDSTISEEYDNDMGSTQMFFEQSQKMNAGINLTLPSQIDHH